MQGKAEGYVLVTADSSKNAKEQVEATGIWDEITAENEIVE